VAFFYLENGQVLSQEIWVFSDYENDNHKLDNAWRV
jgi:hypothetical protein